MATARAALLTLCVVAGIAATTAAGARAAIPNDLRAVLVAGGYTLHQTSGGSYVATRRAGGKLLVRVAVPMGSNSEAIVGAGLLRTSIDLRLQVTRNLDRQLGHRWRSSITRVRTYLRYVVVDLRATR